MSKYFGILLFLFTLSLQASIDRTRMDPEHNIPIKVLNKALDFYEQNLTKFPNNQFIGIINFKLHNSKERFFVLNTETGDVEKFLVAHGKNSDPDFDGYATSFSNIEQSLQSSLGFYRTAETYYGNHGLSLRLDGLSETNSKARDRAIVIHGAEYVTPGPKIGRSSGCPAVEERYHEYLISKLKDGALIYASYE